VFGYNSENIFQNHGILDTMVYNVVFKQSFLKHGIFRVGQNYDIVMIIEKCSIVKPWFRLTLLPNWS
jgi:hypothetical protein